VSHEEKAAAKNTSADSGQKLIINRLAMVNGKVRTKTAPKVIPPSNNRLVTNFPQMRWISFFERYRMVGS